MAPHETRKRHKRQTNRIVLVLCSTYHEQEQQQHQQKQQGFCDWGRCNGPPTLELFCVPLNVVFSGPVPPLCDVPRSRHPDGNSDTLQDILLMTRRAKELWVITDYWLNIELNQTCMSARAVLCLCLCVCVCVWIWWLLIHSRSFVSSFDILLRVFLV